MRAVGWLVVLSLAWGCGKKAESRQARSYSKDGLRFDHPGDWSVTEDEEYGFGVQRVTIKGHGDAISFVLLMPATVASPIGDYAREFARLTADAKIGIVLPSTFGEPVQSGGYEILTETWAMAGFGEPVPHTRVYRRRAFSDTVCFVITQVADEDRADAEGGFGMITGSLRYEPR